MERKYKDKVFIPPSKSPKVMVTTNYVIRGVGYSHERRKVEFELSEFYGKGRTPLERFGHRLYDDWDTQEWNRFYLFMIGCLQSFLSDGLREADPIHIQERKLMQDIPESILDFIDDKVEMNKEHTQESLYSWYLEQSGDDQTSLRRFMKYLRLYCEITGRSVTETHSGLIRYFSMS